MCTGYSRLRLAVHTIIFPSYTTACFPWNSLTVFCFHLLCFLCTYHEDSPDWAGRLNFLSSGFSASGARHFHLRLSLRGGLNTQATRYLPPCPLPSRSIASGRLFSPLSEAHSASSSSLSRFTTSFGESSRPVISIKYMKGKCLERV